MKNLKVKVSNESESEEAQKLFFELGYKWFSGGYQVQHLKKSCSSSFGYLVAWTSGCFTDVIQCGCGSEAAKEITIQQLKDMVASQNSSDEPFLTPECTLNDQYAEIEQVRQQTIEQTLAERQSQYGSFISVANTTGALMSVIKNTKNGRILPHAHEEALHMICSKIARIVNGDYDFLDNWHDIGGYSKLIENLIEGKNASSKD